MNPETESFGEKVRKAIKRNPKSREAVKERAEAERKRYKPFKQRERTKGE